MWNWTVNSGDLWLLLWVFPAWEPFLGPSNKTHSIQISHNSSSRCKCHRSRDEYENSLNYNIQSSIDPLGCKQILYHPQSNQSLVLNSCTSRWCLSNCIPWDFSRSDWLVFACEGDFHRNLRRFCSEMKIKITTMICWWWSLRISYKSYQIKLQNTINQGSKKNQHINTNVKKIVYCHFKPSPSFLQPKFYSCWFVFLQFDLCYLILSW